MSGGHPCGVAARVTTRPPPPPVCRSGLGGWGRGTRAPPSGSAPPAPPRLERTISAPAAPCSTVARSHRETTSAGCRGPGARRVPGANGRPEAGLASGGPPSCAPSARRGGPPVRGSVSVSGQRGQRMVSAETRFPVVSARQRRTPLTSCADRLPRTRSLREGVRCDLPARRTVTARPPTLRRRHEGRLREAFANRPGLHDCSAADTQLGHLDADRAGPAPPQDGEKPRPTMGGGSRDLGLNSTDPLLECGLAPVQTSGRIVYFTKSRTISK